MLVSREKRANTLQSVASGGIAEINIVTTLLKEQLYFTVFGLTGGYMKRKNSETKGMKP